MVSTTTDKSKLVQLLNILKKKNNEKEVFNYVIPDLWNAWDYSGEEMVHTSWGELMVNPYNFYSSVIESYILPKADKAVNYNQSLSKINETVIDRADYLGGDWIKQAVVYSMMVRTSTSWDHDRSGDLEEKNIYGLKETGTSVKSLALLPLLKKMGVNTVYMLPISKFSLKDKKGELGSPYGVCNFFQLDPSLKDTITDHEMTVEEEFQAFVEACHILDMKVMIDIIPRTNSVESELILENPEWFYWVYTDTFHEYYPPHVPGLGNTLVPKPEFLPQVYQSQDVWNHIHKFSYAPNIVDPLKWATVVEEYHATEGASILELVQREFGLTVAPAFSDHINDP
ncbi:MAG: alpha-amylase, partial [Turicibacter sp.]